MRSWVVTLCCLVASVAWAQKTVTVVASYTYHVPENVTVEQAKTTALERAKVQAVADEFGTLIGQSNSTLVTNENGKSDTHFSSIGRSDVNGEWIETIGEPQYAINYEQGMLIVNVKVKGRIRKLAGPKIDLAVNILRNGTELKYESDDFRNGDDMYLHFQSPVSGSLLVYLVDYTARQVYCLLPYSQQADMAQPIEQGREYLFFSADKAAANMKQLVDEYNLTCSQAMEQNEVVILFSPNDIVKANSTAGTCALPRSTDFGHFEKWLVGLRNHDSKLQIVKKTLTIKR